MHQSCFQDEVRAVRGAIATPVMIALTVAVVTDMRSRRIPNWLVAPFLFGGLSASSWFHGWNGILHSIAGISLGFGVYLIPFLLGGMGAGDVKLCAAVGAWIWPQQLIVAIVITGLAGGIIAICTALCGQYLLDVLINTGEILAFWKKKNDQDSEEAPQWSRAKRTIPYSPAIAIGTAISFLSVMR